MYAIFELSLNTNSCTIRLSYAIVFGNKQFTLNSIRSLGEENRKISTFTKATTDNSITTELISTQSISQDQYSSSLSSSSNVIHNDLLAHNNSIDTNTDSY
jgi:hypothetical protein